MSEFNKAPALLIAGMSLMGIASPEMAAAQDKVVGSAVTTEQYIFGLDESGQPDFSTAPGGEQGKTLRYHQGAIVEVTSECDETTGVGSSSMQLTTKARNGDTGTVSWGFQDSDGEEFFRQDLPGGRTVIVPKLPSGDIKAGWVEVDDTEGADTLAMTAVDAANRLEDLADAGLISPDTRDDYRAYDLIINVPVCEKVIPATTTVPETTSTTAPATTSTTTSTTVFQPATTLYSSTTTIPTDISITSISREEPVVPVVELATTGSRPLGAQVAAGLGLLGLGGAVALTAKRQRAGKR